MPSARFWRARAGVCVISLLFEPPSEVLTSALEAEAFAEAAVLEAEGEFT